MNEWKELEIDNLPRDILTGDYKFEVYRSNWDEKNPTYPITSVLRDLIDGGKWRYRKPEPKVPNHEEITTKWWKYNDKVYGRIYWHKVFTYYPEDKIYGLLFGNKDDGRRSFVDKNWFTGRESANTPPED